MKVLEEHADHPWMSDLEAQPLEEGVVELYSGVEEQQHQELEGAGGWHACYSSPEW